MEEKYKNPNSYWYYNQRCASNYSGNMKGCMFNLAGIIILLILSLLFSSCQAIKYVPVETVKIEKVNVHDTIKQSDTVNTQTNTIIRESRPEDSLMLAELGIKLKANERLLILLQKQMSEKNSQTYERHNKDSVRVDSVQVPYPVEKPLTKWQQFKLDVGGIAMSVVVVFILLIVLIWLVKKKRKRL